ncbi:hypothetical protein [Streptococcus ferus]|uniref:hypothetical protein n=1 Tax=Streptococcus ferus TaxID=1345 RepID=UPI0035A1455C
MKKKVFGLMVLVLSVFALIACSNSSSSLSGDNLEGKYHLFYGETSNDVFLSKNPSIVIEGDVAKEGYPGESQIIYKVDKEKKLFEGDNKTLSYTLKDDVLTLSDNNTYVKAGSDKYKELKKKDSD